MAIISADVARQKSQENSSYEAQVARESFNRAIEIESALGETSTQFEKKYFNLDLILTEIQDAGYSVTDQGETYLVDWT